MVKLYIAVTKSPCSGEADDDETHCLVGRGLYFFALSFFLVIIPWLTLASYSLSTNLTVTGLLDLRFTDKFDVKGLS